jgi:hypothetical protein
MSLNKQVTPTQAVDAFTHEMTGLTTEMLSSSYNSFISITDRLVEDAIEHGFLVVQPDVMVVDALLIAREHSGIITRQPIMGLRAYKFEGTRLRIEQGNGETCIHAWPKHKRHKVSSSMVLSQSGIEVVAPKSSARKLPSPRLLQAFGDVLEEAYLADIGVNVLPE